MNNNITELKIILVDFCGEMQVSLSQNLKILWLAELQKEDFNAVKQAINKIITGSHKVFGKVGLRHILEQIRSNTQQQEQLAQEQSNTQADQAYIEFRRCIRDSSPYLPLKHKDKVLIACIEQLGGWYKVTAKDQKTLDYLKRDFIERYKYLAKENIEALPNSTSSYIEQQNRNISNTRMQNIAQIPFSLFTNK